MCVCVCVCVFVAAEKAKSAFHKACRKEHMAREREAHAQGNPEHCHREAEEDPGRD